MMASTHTTAAPQVSVSDIRLLGTTGSIRAPATVRYGPPLAVTTIHGVKVFDSARGITIGDPQQQFTHDGKTRYTSIVSWDQPLHTAITEAVTRAYHEATGTIPTDLFAEVEL
jgi:DNA-binding cell septation regulator SpoVG